MASEALLTTLRVLTFITAIAVGLSPFPEIYRVYKDRAAGEVSIFPVVTLFGNSAEQETIARFYKLWGSTTVLLAAVTMYAAVAVAGVTHQSNHQVVTILGYMSVAMNLLLKFAPLETIKRIIRSRNASSMPVTMSVVAFVNGCLWVWTSAILDDMFVLTPNAAGAALGGIQVIVYVMYRPGKAIAAQPCNELDHDQRQISADEPSGYSVDPEHWRGKERTRSSVFVELRSPA
ncbi:unnamed protein product [Phytophthora lilii]|uniref:Sugar transporter SWEET1 n=1 Tax=Phytophthora lilii TaxID=2077276 RepID=A0A9W6TY10_9STRA|nr:unnamed protein product [Phytophthora lilii]